MVLAGDRGRSCSNAAAPIWKCRCARSAAARRARAAVHRRPKFPPRWCWLNATTRSVPEVHTSGSSTAIRTRCGHTISTAQSVPVPLARRCVETAARWRVHTGGPHMYQVAGRLGAAAFAPIATVPKWPAPHGSPHPVRLRSRTRRRAESMQRQTSVLRRRAGAHRQTRPSATPLRDLPPGFETTRPRRSTCFGVANGYGRGGGHRLVPPASDGKRRLAHPGGHPARQLAAAAGIATSWRPPCRSRRHCLGAQAFLCQRGRRWAVRW